MKISITNPQNDLLIEVNGETVYGKAEQPPPPPNPFEPRPSPIALSTVERGSPFPSSALKKAGDFTRNAYGYMVEQLTDVPTGAQHYYVAPHPINAQRNKLVYTAASGGGLFLRNLETGKTQQIITNDWKTPLSFAWHPKEDALFVTLNQDLYIFNDAANVFVLVQKFDASWTSAPIFLGQTDGNRFVFDYRQQNKVSVGVAWFDRQNNETRMVKGLTLNNAPQGMNLTGASADPSMRWVFTQVNGINPSTLTYVCEWGDNPITESRLMLDPVPEAPQGIVTNHGITTDGMHHRIVSGAIGDPVGYTQGPSGPIWLSAIRSIDLATRRQEDRFVWGPASGFHGAHLSGNENHLLLSTYKVTPPLPDETIQPFNGELILMRKNGLATFEPKYPQPSKVTNPSVIRIGAHGSSGQGYWGQPRASMDRAGKEVVFTSDVSGVLQVYRIHIA